MMHALCYLKDKNIIEALVNTEIILIGGISSYLFLRILKKHHRKTLPYFMVSEIHFFDTFA